MENYYELFGVSPDASKAEIERAYKRLSKAYHPDAGATNDHMFKKIHEVYKILMDNDMRAAYNRDYASAVAEEEAAAETAVRKTAVKTRSSTTGRETGRASQKPKPEDWSTPAKEEKPDSYALLKKADELLEKGSWKKADEAYAAVLKEKPKEAKAWLGRLMADLHVKEKSELANVPKSFERNEYYARCLKCAGRMLSEELTGYMETSRDRILSEKYDAAVAKMKACDSPKSWQQVAVMFKSLGAFKDAETLAKRCKSKSEGVKSDDIYKRGKDLMDRGDAESLVDAVGCFQKILFWKDSEEQVAECYRLLADLKAKEADRPYQSAVAAMKSAETMQDYSRAADMFEALGDYRDAAKKARTCRKNAESSRLDVMYRKAVENMNGEKISSYEDAIAIFKELDGWKDSEEQIARCQKMILEIKRTRYQKATELMENAADVQDYIQAANLFAGLPGYRDSRKQAENCRQEAAYVSGMKKLSEVSMETPARPEKLGRAHFLDELASCNEAAELFGEIPEWKDAKEKEELCKKRAEELKKLILKIPEKKDRKSGIVFIALIAAMVILMIAGAIVIKSVSG